MSEQLGAVRVVHGDITSQDTDVIVNAANEHLAHGAGLAAALVRAGGSVIQEESEAWIRRHGPVGSGSAAVTGAGAMPARWIVHVVGPRYRAGQDNTALLEIAVTTALSAAAELGATSVAMPAISSGIFGYPTNEAAGAIAGACRAWLSAHPGTLEDIRLVGYDAATVAAFEQALS